MKVSVIIVNYNTFSITCDCIASVIHHTRGIDYEIVVVDNASPTDNPDEFLQRFPSIKLVKSTENGGFAKGNNQGIAAATGDVFLLLNSDTVLIEDSISKAAKVLATDNNIGALTVRLIYPDGKLQHTARKFRSIRNELMDLCRPFLKLLPYRKRADLMLNQYFNGDFNTRADWVSGAFMMFRKNILSQLPGNRLDERFFMYGEDELWCMQFADLGYYNYYLSETTVIHIHAASTAPDKQLKLLKKFLELELYLIKYKKGNGVYYLVFKMIFTAKEMARYYVKTIALSVFGKKIR